MYKAGDKVAHPGHGGCTVTEICMQPSLKGSEEYLVLRAYGDKGMRILIPVANVDRSGLRDIITPEAADKLLDAFADVKPAEAPLEKNFTKRRQAYIDIIKTGSLEALVNMICELSCQPKLGNSDKDMLPRAEKRLYSEIALAKGLDMDQVMEIAKLRMQPAAAL